LGEAPGQELVKARRKLPAIRRGPCRPHRPSVAAFTSAMIPAATVKGAQVSVFSAALRAENRPVERHAEAPSPAFPPDGPPWRRWFPSSPSVRPKRSLVMRNGREGGDPNRSGQSGFPAVTRKFCAP